MALMQKKMLKYIAIFAGTVEHHSYFSWLMGVVNAVVGVCTGLCHHFYTNVLVEPFEHTIC
jgi:hypothetical protein